MTEPTEAAAARGRRDAPSLAAIRAELQRLVAADQAEPVAAFADIFLANIPADLFHERGPELLARLVLDAFRFLERAWPEGVHVEVAPSGTGTVVRTVLSDRPFIIDTLRESIAARGLAIGYLIYRMRTSPWSSRVGCSRSTRAAPPMSIQGARRSEITPPIWGTHSP